LAKKRDAVRSQVGALVFRRSEGLLEVLLVTSRDTGRWIIPKGWPMHGKSDARAAEIEAREEAGVVCKGRPREIGSYLYFKRQATHFELCRVTVYLMEFSHHLSDWPEKGQRRLRWLRPVEAATMVQEPGLAALIERPPAGQRRKPRLLAAE
jgi:8-oxo-dGTP pyrophosphatase MutT (NUDIX family)